MSVEVFPPWNPLPLMGVAGLVFVLVSLYLLPLPALRPQKKGLSHWQVGILGVFLGGLFSFNYPIAVSFTVASLGIFLVLSKYGGERSENAAWEWLVASLIAVLIMWVTPGIGYKTGSGPWQFCVLLLLMAPVWPFSFWWQNTLSQSPLHLLILFPFFPLFFFDFISIVPVDFRVWFNGLALFSMFLAAISLGRQSDLKLFATLTLWVWVLLFYIQAPHSDWLQPHYHTIEAPNTSLHDTVYLIINVSFLYVPILPLVLAFTALVLLLGHLQKVAGSTYIEDFHPLAANPRLHRFRRCWTLTSWLLAGLPVTLLWTDLSKWVTRGITENQHSIWWVAFLLLALVFLAGSLFHLRARLFYGDAQTNGKVVVKDLGIGTYLLIIALLALALILPWLQP